MKKIILVFILLITVVVFVKQFNTKDYILAEKLVTAGDYKGFYAEIKNGLLENNEDARELLLEAFLIAVQDNDIEEVTYYLNQNRTIVDSFNAEGYRAIDVALSNKTIELEIIKVLLTYNPELNYKIKYLKNFTPIQYISSTNKEQLKNAKALELLISAGADINYYAEDGDASSSALLLSYVSDNIEMFKILIENGANIKASNESSIKNKNDILSYIAGSYVLELTKYKVDLSAFYKKPVDEKIKSILKSESYRIIHKKNLEYLKIIANNNTLKESSDYGLKKLANFYAATNEVDGFKILSKNIINKEELIEISLLNDNRAILHIVNENKGK